MTLSRQIADYVRDIYVEPARMGGRSFIEVRVGDVHRALGLKNRVASVCNTLESQKFQKENHLSLWKSSGPASGRSTTVSFAYHLLNPVQSADAAPKVKPRKQLKETKLMALSGLCEETFRSLGGGQEFLRRERAWGPDARKIYEEQERERLSAVAAK